MSLSRPVALITGAAHRIGKEITLALHSRGVDIALHCHLSTQAADQLRAELNNRRTNSCAVFIADLSSPLQAKHLPDQINQHFGRLDYLINNASIFYPTPVDMSQNDTAEELSEKKFTRFMNTNFVSPVQLAISAYQYLKQQRGAVLNLIDIYAQRGLEEHSAYVASKEALLTATKSLAMELAPEVRVNGISPGAILWPNQDFESNQALKSIQSPNLTQHLQDKNTNIIKNTALRRKGEAKDISATACYLLLDASYSTGSIIAVDGGRQLYI
ncbi:MAG: SDR family oxidoreductase [Kangiellaceae bacterium]|nr:SDR family oxidoreductase [Kangiellaceae bacterium]